MSRTEDASWRRPLSADVALWWQQARTFPAVKRRKLADKGHALPDGSFPIETTGDLRNALAAFGRASDPAAAKAHIIKRAKALGATGMLPDSWKT